MLPPPPPPLPSPPPPPSQPSTPRLAPTLLGASLPGYLCSPPLATTPEYNLASCARRSWPPPLCRECCGQTTLTSIPLPHPSVPCPKYRQYRPPRLKHQGQGCPGICARPHWPPLPSMNGLAHRHPLDLQRQGWHRHCWGLLCPPHFFLHHHPFCLPPDTNSTCPYIIPRQSLPPTQPRRPHHRLTTAPPPPHRHHALPTLAPGMCRGMGILLPFERALAIHSATDGQPLRLHLAARPACTSRGLTAAPSWFGALPTCPWNGTYHRCAASAAHQRGVLVQLRPRRLEALDSTF